MKKFFPNDDSVTIFNSREELRDYNQFRKENDKWIVTPIKNVGAYGISNLPLFIEERAKHPSVKIKGFAVPVNEIDLNNDENKECIEDSGLFIVVETEDGYVAIPTDHRALGSIYSRTDDYCGIMLRDRPKIQKAVLPVEEKAERITRDAALFEGWCKILVRDGKVRYDASQQYTITDNEELLLTLEESLKKDHPGFTFSEGSACHEYLVARYLINDKMQEESLRLKLNNHGCDLHTVTSGVQFLTSDIGMSAVRANVFFVIDGKTVFLKGIAINHKDEELEQNFKEQLKNFAKILTESEDRIEELGNTDIKNVAATVKTITENIPSVFPSTTASEVMTELEIMYPNGGTAIDVYLALVDIVDRHCKKNDLPLARQLDLTESVAGLIALPFDKIDTGEYKFKK